MSIENFELLDIEPIDNSIIKRDFSKVHHQQGEFLNNPGRNVESMFGENNNYHQIGNAYLQYIMTICEVDGNICNAEVVRLINYAFTYCFKEARR